MPHSRSRAASGPTDGIFARTNRRVSIPISRQIIRFPITPNMVSLFTLAVSFAAGVFFALGGYWNMLVGAILSWLSSAQLSRWVTTRSRNSRAASA